jgi:hypothetical protein
VVNNPPGISLRLAQTSSGFALTDDQGNVEVLQFQPMMPICDSRR